MLLIGVLILAAFYNFTAVLSAAVFGLAIAWARPQEQLKVRLIRLLSFGLVFSGLLVALGLAALAVLISPARLLDPAFWKTATFAGHPEYEVQPVSDTLRAVLSFAKSQISYPGLDPTGSLSQYWDAASIGARVSLVAFYGVVLLIMALPLFILIFRRKAAESFSWISGVLLVWLLFYVLFNIFWDPGYTKYWLIPLVGWWVAVVVALNRLRLNSSQWYRPAFGLVVLLIAFSFGLNFTTQFFGPTVVIEPVHHALSPSRFASRQTQALYLSRPTASRSIFI